MSDDLDRRILTYLIAYRAYKDAERAAEALLKKANEQASLLNWEKLRNATLVGVGSPGVGAPDLLFNPTKWPAASDLENALNEFRAKARQLREHWAQLKEPERFGLQAPA
jgi:hypothetical protein